MCREGISPPKILFSPKIARTLQCSCCCDKNVYVIWIVQFSFACSHVDREIFGVMTEWECRFEHREEEGKRKADDAANRKVIENRQVLIFRLIQNFFFFCVLSSHHQQLEPRQRIPWSSCLGDSFTWISDWTATWCASSSPYSVANIRLDPKQKYRKLSL